jgi:putative addiction module antidote
MELIMYETSIRKIGNSAGFNLTKEMLKEMNLNIGDNVYFVKIDDGEYKLCSFNSEQVEALKTAKNITSKYKNLLKALANK